MLCAGIDPDPLGKCKGTWARPDAASGCIGIIQRGQPIALDAGDGLAHIGESWTRGHDGSGRYLTGHGTGNFLTYTHDFGSSAAAGDFTMTAQMKLFDLDGSAGTFMINDGHSSRRRDCHFDDTHFYPY